MKGYMGIKIKFIKWAWNCVFVGIFLFFYRLSSKMKRVKIIDFGLCRHIDDKRNDRCRVFQPRYTALECLDSPDNVMTNVTIKSINKSMKPRVFQVFRTNRHLVIWNTGLAYYHP
jgi:hypothetical protein